MDTKPKTAKPADRFTVTVPNTLDRDGLNRLENLISSKKTLLTKSLRADKLEIKQNEDNTLSFPWFTLSGADGEALSYTHLITAMVKMAKESTRISQIENVPENEKFAMRIFTVRLGLKGDEYKVLRKLLMQNLTGNSAWKNGAPEKPAKDSKQTKPKKAETPSTIPAEKNADKSSGKGGSTL